MSFSDRSTQSRDQPLSLCPQRDPIVFALCTPSGLPDSTSFSLHFQPSLQSHHLQANGVCTDGLRKTKKTQKKRKRQKQDRLASRPGSSVPQIDVVFYGLSLLASSCFPLPSARILLSKHSFDERCQQVASIIYQLSIPFDERQNQLAFHSH